MKSIAPVAMALRGIEAYSASFGILDEDDPAGFLHRLDAGCAVRPRAGEHDREAVAVLLGERGQEEVDRRPVAARLVEFLRRELGIGDPRRRLGGIT